MRCSMNDKNKKIPSMKMIAEGYIVKAEEHKEFSRLGEGIEHEVIPKWE